MMQAPDVNSPSVLDRLLIRERYDRYADAAFRADVEAYLDCWAEAGVRLLAGQECRGKAALREQWTATWAILERMAFFTQLGPMAVEGDTAHASCHCLETLHMKDGSRRTVIGRYTDVLIRQGGDWLYQRREYQLHMDRAEPG